MISQIKKILYATDLSKNSAYAFFYAADLARRREARIVILHAVEPAPPHVERYYGRFYGEGVEKVKEQQKKEITEEVKRRVELFCQKAGAHLGGPCLELVSKILVLEGHPVEEILKVADDEGCDLLVLGNHGKGFLKQTFLGSVSRSVLDRIKKPVLIVPLPPEEVDIDWAEMS